ncbi:uncharacterized protein RIC-3 isoform X5 [Anabrus simplex]|uniref:uncharacterized protein RIC-3 isoform X5 n=1 Tax=Anabrus simplex TaxID=316456 RepID=UPI0035A2B94B
MAVEFGTAKTVLILAIVVGCFAVLWPKLFYPMLQASFAPRSPMDSSAACCDVIFENDVNAIKIMMEMCGNILHRYDEFDPKLSQTFEQGKLSKDIVNTCRTEVLNKCDVDITDFLNERVRLGRSYKQMLDDIRTYNHSVCLKVNFGITLGALGTPRRMRIGELHMPRHHRQERPPHLRPDLLHPALRERGRAIPQSHIVPRTVEKEARPGPIPGMRPPMGGAGHVVPAPKGSSTMGIIMPIYTIGIVIFFMYTIMKVMFKKPSDSTSSYGEFTPDPEFRKVVFAEEYVDDRSQLYEETLCRKPKRESSPPWKSEENSKKLGWKETNTRDIEIDHLRKRLEETEAAMERIVAQMGLVPRQFHSGTGSSRAKSEDITDQRLESNKAVQRENSLPNIPQQSEEDIKKVVETSSSSETELQMEAEKSEGVIKQPENVALEPITQAISVKTSIEQESKSSSEQEHTEDPVKSVEQVETECEDGSAKVKVMGIETTASCEGGLRWSRPNTPTLGMPLHSRSVTPVPPPTPEPQAIFLEGALPSQSQVLVSDSEIQALPVDPSEVGSDTDPPVILSGKMTLSLISLDAALAAEDEQLQQRQEKEQKQPEKPDESSSKIETVRAIRVNVDDETAEEEEEMEGGNSDMLMIGLWQYKINSWKTLKKH